MNFSDVLLERLDDFTDYYVNDQWEFDPVAVFKHVDVDFPGWTKLVESIKRFHSKFVKVNKYHSISLVKYESDEELCCIISNIVIRLAAIVNQKK